VIAATTRQVLGRSAYTALFCAVLAAAAVILTADSHGLRAAAAVPPPPTTAPSASPTAVQAPVISAAALNALPEANTEADLPAAPRDRAPLAASDGTVAHNPRPVAVFDQPGGTAFARLPTRQLGSDTWSPVIAQRPGWVLVLLPSRPNGATGWLSSTGLQLAHTPYLIGVDLRNATLRLRRDGHILGQWPTAIGTPQSPTPAGRTFVLASIVERLRHFATVVLPLGAHSPTLHSYAGGPGTIALHGWPTDVFGQQVSHGCLRLPPTALGLLRRVPLGTLVLIDPA
jgi:lipoprotein-anchoring transpeptidase ErfK/SrfK